LFCYDDEGQTSFYISTGSQSQISFKNQTRKKARKKGKIITQKRGISITSVIVLVLLLIAVPAAFASPLMAPANDFVITVQTDNSGTSSATQFTIPTTGGGYNYNVDCDNDGSNEAIAQTGEYTCNYGAGNEGTYTIRIKDNSGAGTGFCICSLKHKTHSFECAISLYNYTKWRGAGLNRRPRAYEPLAVRRY